MSETNNSTAARIVRALAPFGYPVAQGNSPTDDETYFAFTMDATPDDFGDDEPHADIIGVMLHLFAPFTQNTTKLRRKIRRAIFDAGFTYPDMVDASETTRQSDGTEQHIVFEFEDAIGVDEDGI